jgi:hypothetical protein
MIKELIDHVEEEYNNYDVDKLVRSFVTLQSCMIEIMKEGGGIFTIGFQLVMVKPLLVKTIDFQKYP